MAEFFSPENLPYALMIILASFAMLLVLLALVQDAVRLARETRTAWRDHEKLSRDMQQIVQRLTTGKGVGMNAALRRPIRHSKPKRIPKPRH
jgi:hypothetical protein